MTLLASAVALAACRGSDGDTTDDAPATVAPTATADAAPTSEVEESTAAADTAAPVTTSEVAVPETPSTAPAELDEDVFSFGRDDLCQWVTEDEVAEMVSAVYPWEGSAELEEPVVDDALCTWKLTGGDGHGYLYADDASEWVHIGAGPYDFAAELAAEPAVEYREIGRADVWPFAVSGHPGLSEGVLVHSAGFGQMAFWVPPREEYLAFSMAVPDAGDVYDEDRFFVVADAFLQELGWVPASGTAPATNDPVEPVGTNESVAIFDAESDDLCEWVTGDEVVEFLTAAGADIEGPATASEPWTDDATGWNCGWMLASGDEIQLGAKSTNRLSSSEDLNMVAEYTEPGQVMQPGAMVSGHPNLSQGVVVENQAFLRFAFYTPTTEAQLNLQFTGDWDSDTYEAVVMGTADAVLDELGWLPT
jgi:hypothetical protein